MTCVHARGHTCARVVLHGPCACTCAVWVRLKSLRINSHASIFTAELVALNLSLDIIRRSKRKKFAIFLDSLSSLLAINNRHLETGYVQKFITDYSHLSNSGKIIILIWIPAILVSEVMSLLMRLPNQPLIWVCQAQLWNALPLTCILMWLITVSISGRSSGTDVSQTNYTLSNLSSATVIWVVSVVKMLLFSGVRRLRIGHTRLTHSYLLNRQDQPECSHCDCVLTVAHVLLGCNHYNMVRQRYFNVSSLCELFDTVNAQNILGFIRDIGLYRLL